MTTNVTLPACWRRTAFWCGLGLLASIGIGLLAGFLPARARLLGLFGVGEGLLVGAALAELVSRLRMPRPRLRVLVPTSFVCGLAAFALTTLIGWQSFSRYLLKEYPPPPTNMLALQLQTKNSSPTGTEFSEESQEFKRDIDDLLAAHETELSARRSWPGYLVYRVTGEVSAQNAGLVSAQVISERQASAWAKWLGELAATGIAASVMAHRATRRIECQ